MSANTFVNEEIGLENLGRKTPLASTLAAREEVTGCKNRFFWE